VLGSLAIRTDVESPQNGIIRNLLVSDSSGWAIYRKGDFAGTPIKQCSHVKYSRRDRLKMPPR